MNQVKRRISPPPSSPGAPTAATISKIKPLPSSPSSKSPSEAEMKPMGIGTYNSPEYGQPASLQRRHSFIKKGAVVFITLAAITTMEFNNTFGIKGGVSPVASNAEERNAAFKKFSKSKQELSMISWNVAAINNNPFEYWITIDEGSKYKKSYDDLMVAVENFLENPTDNDVPVEDVFTQEMYNSLESRMLNDAHWDKNDLDTVREYWKSDYSKRKIITGFMKDPILGSKRLASMPDRVTNTVSVIPAKKGQPDLVFRPTVINMYEGDLSTSKKWFDQWIEFFFDKSFKIEEDQNAQKAYEILLPIKQSKYPDLTPEEEAVSIPLQLVCQGIFDAILVHMMNSVAKPSEWQGLKMEIVSALNKKKADHTLGILQKTYSDMDVITLQEVSASLISDANKKFGKKYHVVAPEDIDVVRDQNSVILLKKSTFPGGKVQEVTSSVQSAFPPEVKVPVAKGDILAITTADRFGIPYVVASFHGDTNGLATVPVFRALSKVMNNSEELKLYTLLFGLDANTYEHGVVGKKQDNMEFRAYIKKEAPLTHCWGDVPPEKAITTFNSRTYLQPQLNKACKSTEKRKNGDINPKDFIIFNGDDFVSVKTWKDNTGKKKYVEDMAFPTLTFPSDHGVLGTILKSNK